MGSSGRKLHPPCPRKPSAPTEAQRHSEDVAETFLSVESGQTPNRRSPANPWHYFKKQNKEQKPELVTSHSLSLVKTRGRILKAAGRRRSESSLTTDFSAATAEPTRQRGDVFTPLEGNNSPRDVRVPTARTWHQLALHGSWDAAAVMGVWPLRWPIVPGASEPVRASQRWEEPGNVTGSWESRTAKPPEGAAGIFARWDC